MNVSPKTGMGLTVHNSTYYNTLDLVELLTAFEKKLKTGKRDLTLSNWAVNGQISFRDYSGSRDAVRVYRKGYIGDERLFAIAGQGMSRGVVKLRKPNKMFANELEQMVWEATEPKTAPKEFTVNLLRAVAHAYQIGGDQADRLIDLFDTTLFPIRVMKNRSRNPKRKNNMAELREARSSLASMEFRLAGIVSDLKHVMRHFDEETAGSESMRAKVVKILGSFPEFDAVVNMIATASAMQQAARDHAAQIVAPEFMQEAE